MAVKKESGVYRILCIENGNMYIGSSSDLYTREKSHFSQLRRGAHHCEHLQRAFNKYGSDKFRWEILEYCPVDSTEKYLCEKEQTHIDKYWNDGIVYNPNRRAETAGRKASDETREKLRRIQNSPERKAYQSAILTGRKHTKESLENLIAAGNNPETKAKRSAASKRVNADPERRAKQAELMTGRKHTEETRAKMSVIQNDPERRKRQSEKMKGRRPSDKQIENLRKTLGTQECKEKLSVSMKKRWEDPEYRMKMTEVSKSQKHSDERRAKMSALHKTPEMVSRKVRGESSPNAKLTNNDVIIIKKSIADKQISKTDLAKKYNVSVALIRAIGSGRAWKHITLPPPSNL